jgi:hypothetical protein
LRTRAKCNTTLLPRARASCKTTLLPPLCPTFAQLLPHFGMVRSKNYFYKILISAQIVKFNIIQYSVYQTFLSDHLIIDNLFSLYEHTNEYTES